MKFLEIYKELKITCKCMHYKYCLKICFVILEFFFSSKFKIIIYLKDVIFWIFMKIFENTVEIISNIDFGKIKKKLVSIRY